MNIELLTNQIINCCTYGAGIGMIISLCEWVVSYFVRAVKDKLGSGSRV